MGTLSVIFSGKLESKSDARRENETGKLKRTEKRRKRSGKCEEKGKREAGEVGGRQAREQQSAHQIMNLPLVFSPSRLYLWKKEERRG